MYVLWLPLDDLGRLLQVRKMNPPILQADKLLADANLPTYTQAMGALLALAREIGSMPHVDQHQVFKAWVILDRYSINSKHV